MPYSNPPAPQRVEAGFIEKPNSKRIYGRISSKGWRGECRKPAHLPPFIANLLIVATIPWQVCAQNARVCLQTARVMPKTARGLFSASNPIFTFNLLIIKEKQIIKGRVKAFSDCAVLAYGNILTARVLLSKMPKRAHLRAARIKAGCELQGNTRPVRGKWPCFPPTLFFWAEA